MELANRDRIQLISERRGECPPFFFYLVTKMRRHIANLPRETLSAGGARRLPWEGKGRKERGARGLGKREVEGKGVIWVAEDQVPT